MICCEVKHSEVSDEPATADDCGGIISSSGRTGVGGDDGGDDCDDDDGRDCDEGGGDLDCDEEVMGIRMDSVVILNVALVAVASCGRYLTLPRPGPREIIYTGFVKSSVHTIWGR